MPPRTTTCRRSSTSNAICSARPVRIRTTAKACRLFYRSESRIFRATASPLRAHPEAGRRPRLEGWPQPRAQPMLRDARLRRAPQHEVLKNCETSLSQPALVLDEPRDIRHAIAHPQVRHHEGPDAAHLLRVALHHLKRGADIG